MGHPIIAFLSMSSLPAQVVGSRSPHSLDTMNSVCEQGNEERWTTRVTRNPFPMHVLHWPLGLTKHKFKD